MKMYTSEEIKNRLSNIGAAIGTIALEYIVELEKEIEQLKNDKKILALNCSSEEIKWNKQSEKDLYKEASSTWDFNHYLCILKNGKFALAISICDEGADGSVSCWFEFCNEKLDEQYYIDDIEYWVLLKKPK